MDIFTIVLIVACVWAFIDPDRFGSYTGNTNLETKRQIDELHKQQTYKFWRDIDK